MNYTWNFRLFVEVYLSFVMRQSRNVALLYSLLKPAETIFTTFNTFRGKTNNTLLYNGQTASLQHALNNLYDATLRRIIVVTDGDRLTDRFTYNRSETGPLWTTHNRGEDEVPIYSYNRGEDITNIYDFYVLVPASTSSIFGAQIAASINKYKIYNKKYLIITT